jgi:quinol monooxygenase YgiN
MWLAKTFTFIAVMLHEALMIRHIVFFSVTQKDQLATVEAALRQLATIPFADCLTVGRNMRIDKFSSEIDLVVYGEFKDQAALEAFHEHPVYKESVKVVRPMREIRVAADIEA